MEIGAWAGKSTGALLAGSSGRTIHTVDNWNGRCEAYSENITGEMVREAFYARVQPAINACRLKVFEGDYREVLPVLDKGAYDLIFVDGPHGEEHAEPTVRLTLPLLRAGGRIALHDADGSWPGVNQMVERIQGTGEFEHGRVVETMAIFRRKQGQD